MVSNTDEIYIADDFRLLENLAAQTVQVAYGFS
jgi:hypothetical protein